MRNVVLKSLLSLGVAGGILCAILLIVTIISSSQVRAQQTALSSGERLITVHDNGQDRGILTRATTLRQAFLEANIPVDPNDLIEPGIDEQLVASNYDINVYRARPVTVVDGNVKQKVMSPYQTAKQIAFHAGITLQNEDTATLEANSNMVSEGAGMQMTITRATGFTLVLYGTKTTAYTQEKTVGEMLVAKNITVAAEDTLSVAPETPIQPGMIVELWRNGKQTATEERDEPFPIEKIKDMDREVGYRQVKTPGILGKRTVTYEIEMRDGKEIARREVQSVITKEPVKQVEVVGGKISNTFTGSFAEALARLRMCEAGGVYTRNSGNGYYGAYQYNISTWANYGGYAIPSDAPPAVQDEKAWLTYQRRGWQPWPACSTKLGLQDIYR